MSKLISSEDHLRRYVPNLIQSVKGEVPFIDKISDFINAAEMWVASNILSQNLFDKICDSEDENSLKYITSRIVAYDALFNAIPSLDVVLTPNGFGIVSTNNLAPASQHRVEALRKSFEVARDEQIIILLDQLHTCDVWLDSQQGKFFASTLFPNINLVSRIEDCQDGRLWQKFIIIQQEVIKIENKLAEKYFSHELMAQLRREEIRQNVSGLRKKLIVLIKSIIISLIRNKPVNHHAFSDMVNLIRKNPDSFPEWHTSETAALFSPPVFENKKKAAGYFF